jgi:ribosomal protein S18 acetylase RimI-like enzyme
VVDITVAAAADAIGLAKLGRDTFVATFDKDNTDEDMALYVEKAFSIETTQQELADESSTFLIARSQDNTSLGYAKLRRGPPEDCVSGPLSVELQRIYIMPEALFCGVGKALLQTCKAMAKETGHQTMWLGVWENNERAVEFYHRQGFVDCGDHVFLLGTDPQRDIIMECDLMMPKGDRDLPISLRGGNCK